MKKRRRAGIFEEMQKAEAVWVTEDSVSMIYEALTAGCKVGLIQIDRVKEDRITRSVQHLIDQKLVSNARQISELYSTTAFKEAERVVGLILKIN